MMQFDEMIYSLYNFIFCFHSLMISFFYIEDDIIDIEAVHLLVGKYPAEKQVICFLLPLCIHQHITQAQMIVV